MDRENSRLVIRGVEGYRYSAIHGRMMGKPLRIEVTGGNGKTAGLRVRWKLQEGPGEAEILNGGVSETDEEGRSWIGVRVGEARGVYLVRATIEDIRDCVDALFSIYTEGVTAELQVMPHSAVRVGERRQVAVRALDWRGEPVRKADLAVFTRSDEIGKKAIRAKYRDGAYQFRIGSRTAGVNHFFVIDQGTKVVKPMAVTFLPGAVKRIEILPIESPRRTAPWNRTLVEARVMDRFGNSIPDARVTWRTDAGKLEAAESREGVTSTARLTVAEADATITARVGQISARRKLLAPGVYLRFLDERRYTPVGGRFGMQLEVFPPVREGTIRKLRISVRQPENAKLRAVHSDRFANIIPAPEVEQTGDLLKLSWTDLDIPLSGCDDCLPVAEFSYDCMGAGETCFEVADAVITTSHSPDEDSKLNPGVGSCRLQKLLSSKDLCVNICLIYRDDSSYREALERAESQVKRAQELFDQNIKICCPDINIRACIHTFPYDEYKDHNPNGRGDHGDWLEVLKAGPANISDPTKDILPLSDTAKWLLTRCRVKECLTVFYVPGLTSGGRPDSGRAINKGSFPETVQGEAGPTIFIDAGATDTGTLIHELGHQLLNSPPSGDDHVDDTTRIMNRGSNGDVGEWFIKEECSKIFDNIGRYLGVCR